MPQPYERPPWYSPAQTQKRPDVRLPTPEPELLLSHNHFAMNVASAGLHILAEPYSDARSAPAANHPDAFSSKSMTSNSRVRVNDRRTTCSLKSNLFRSDPFSQLVFCALSP